MKKQLLMSFVFTAMTVGLSVAKSEVLVVTCDQSGQKAYEAMKNGKLEDAEFSLILEGAGPYADTKIVRAVDESINLIPSLLTINPQKGIAGGTFTLSMRTGNTYEITNLKDCNDVEKATGDMRFCQASNRPFSTTTSCSQIVEGKCSCSNRLPQASESPRPRRTRNPRR